MRLPTPSTCLRCVLACALLGTLTALTLTAQAEPAATSSATTRPTTTRSAVQMELIDAAKQAVGDRLTLPPDELVRIVNTKEECSVTWLLPESPPGVAQGDFAARVIFDPKTRKVAKVLAGS